MTFNTAQTFGLRAHRISHLLHNHIHGMNMVLCYSYARPAPIFQRGNHTSRLSQTTSFLRNLDNGAEIYLVGTAHVSNASVMETKRMIDIVKPDIVMLELCNSRAQRLRAGQINDIDFLREAFSSVFTPNTNISQQLFKVSIQGFYRFLQSLGLDAGGEFKAAMELAEQQGARIVYGDREVQETLRRLAQSFKTEDILKLMLGKGPQPPPAMVNFFDNNEIVGFEAQVEAMKTREMARQMSAFLRQINPAFARALIDERDEIMTSNLRKLSGRIVGIVGLAHLDGIERLWNNNGSLRSDSGGSRGNALPFK